ncbi:MAG TPA: elongation factor G [Croceibacterium sp.]|nr:elongation factor G [Croceibacterium sp.]
MDAIGSGARVVALVGPAGAGKTSLAEALLHAAGAIPRLGSVEAGTSQGDSSPEARARGGSTELNLTRFNWAGDDYVLLDAPGSVGFAAETECALDVADLALLVITPEPERAALAEPALRELEARGVPHAIFVNKIDKARGTLEELLEALQPMSAAALVAREMPISKGEDVIGFVDLALDRAFKYRAGQPSEQVPVPEELQEAESSARFHMLEQLADHDDYLLEQLLEDQVPDRETVFGDLKRETAEGLVVPVMFGSAVNGFGVRRLLKALRHDTPPPSATATRLGLGGPAAEVFKISNDSSVGRLALARVFGKPLAEGTEVNTSAGETQRAGALFGVNGATTVRLKKAEPGDVVGIAKADAVHAGDRLSEGRKPKGRGPRTPRLANSALSIAVQDHKDEVRLSTALNKLIEEDLGLSWETIDETHETLLRGINDEHLSLALDRLKRRYGLAVNVSQPSVAIRETIRKSAKQRGRHKKQSGGHGQYGDVVIELRPLPRGEGFQFEDKITGGVIPRQYIPAVEAGIKDAMQKGPLGCQVVDVAVALVDGSFHSVDSSELAFRTAGRIAMSEALAAAAPYLLEPIMHVTIAAPGTATSRITSALASHRARVLGMTPREGWSRWDTIEALIPEAELHAFQVDLRSLSQGMASYEAKFDHLAEVTGKLAETITQRAREPA